MAKTLRAKLRIIESKVTYFPRIIFNYLGSTFLWKFEKKPLIIIHVDGGISSQIMRIGLGKRFENNGYNVKYEMRFYKVWAYDNDRKEQRRYVIDKCFPSIAIESISPSEFLKYRYFYDYETKLHGHIESTSTWPKNRPLFLSGHSSDHLIKEVTPNKYFNIDEIFPLLGASSLNVLSDFTRIRTAGGICIGVHVRRGDMAQKGGYWKVLTGKYFIEAINRVLGMINTDEVKFFFFSNGFDFVENEILPYVTIKYQCIIGNTEYEDFYLLCKCDIQIASQGSWASLAFGFNNSPQKKLISYTTDKNCKDKTRIYLTEEMYE